MLSAIKKSLYIFAAGITVFLFLFTAPTSHAQATESIQDYSADITINQNSSIRVEEQIQYDFGDIEHHGIFRDIPYKYKARGGTFKLRISDITVTDEKGTQYNFTTSHTGGDLEVKIGDADVTVTGVHTYKIGYTVQRAVNYFDDHDELYWNAIGSEWTVPIAKATAIVHAPAAMTQVVCYTGPANSTAKNCSIEGGNTNTVTFKATPSLEPGNGLTVVVGMPAGTLTKPTTAQKLWDIFLDNGILLLPLFVFALMLFLWRKYGKDPKRKNAIVAQYEAPDKMSALYMGTLIHNKTTNKDIAAEVIYLAANGYLTIKRLETTKLLVFKGTDYEFTKLGKDPSFLAAQSQAFLDELFPDGKTTVSLSYLKKDLSFGKASVKIKSNVMKELVKNGYYKASPVVVKGIYFAAGLGGGILFANILGGTIGFLGALAAILSGVIVIIFSFIMPARTQKGTDTAAEIEGLKLYLTVAEKDRLNFHNAPEKNPEHFEALLPFAIALGVEAAWAAQFSDLTKAPSWYNDSSGSAFNAIIFTNSLNDFSSSMQTVASTATTSASGGSGFSGGGVGGGGGGGGGGSW